MRVHPSPAVKQFCGRSPGPLQGSYIFQTRSTQISEATKQHRNCKKGIHHPPSKTDVCSPCPLVTALANHGYIPRDGHNVRAKDLYTALDITGLSTILRWGFAHGSIVERSATTDGILGLHSQYICLLSQEIWNETSKPERPGRKDSSGIPCQNLDQLALPGAVEHHVSPTRRDIDQGGNITCEDDLVSGPIIALSDGTEITTQDVALRCRQRLKQQEQENPSLAFDSLADQLGCTRIALIQKLFRVKSCGYSVPVPYFKVILEKSGFQ